MPERVFIALGSNLGDPNKQIHSAIGSLKPLAFAQQIRISSLYQSAPLAGMKQPDYINAVVCFDTELAPLDLLHKLQSIENAQGRVRSNERWSARTLDLDILLYGTMVLDSPELKIPHPGLRERNFVIFPLAELDPDLRLPDNTSIQDLLNHCSLEGLTKLD